MVLFLLVMVIVVLVVVVDGVGLLCLTDCKDSLPYAVVELFFNAVSEAIPQPFVVTVDVLLAPRSSPRSRWAL